LQFSGSKILVITRDGYLQRWLQKGNDTVLEEEVPLNGISRLASSAAMTPPHKSPKKSSTLGSIDPNQPLDTQEADQQRKENEELQLDLTIRFAVASDALKLVAAVTSTGRVIVILGVCFHLQSFAACACAVRNVALHGIFMRVNDTNARWVLHYSKEPQFSICFEGYGPPYSRCHDSSDQYNVQLPGCWRVER
jgi:hypothetical protein